MMRAIYRIALLVGLLALIVGGYVGCDRYKGTLTSNQQPVVTFINVSVDSSLFNYAPIIYWSGYDPDGLVEFYSWYDDTTHQAIEAYENDNLVNYVANLPPDVWTNTQETEATIYLLTQTGDTTQHIFFIRCTDNGGAESEVRARSFFRSNEAPNRPMISVLPDENFYYEYTVPDTLLMGDTLTQTYGGLQIIWKGNARY